MRLYLASTSPRRRLILRRLGMRFTLLPPGPAEPNLPPRTDPARFAITSARSKVRSVASLVRRGFIVGVDTVVAVGNLILGKPQTRAEAERMLRLLAGRTHSVVSGVAVLGLPEARLLSAAEYSGVRFRPLAGPELQDYLTSREPYDKAGAYAIQGAAASFVEQVCGSYSNVVGLPALLVLSLLSRSGFRA